MALGGARMADVPVSMIAKVLQLWQVGMGILDVVTESISMIHALSDRDSTTWSPSSGDSKTDVSIPPNMTNDSSTTAGDDSPPPVVDDEEEEEEGPYSGGMMMGPGTMSK